MDKITYTESKINKNIYRTERFGNLLSDTYQGEVDLDRDGTWSAWFFNHSDRHRTEFRLGFKTRAAAARWVNNKLRERGIR
jgi:hypothetical protein